MKTHCSLHSFVFEVYTMYCAVKTLFHQKLCCRLGIGKSDKIRRQVSVMFYMCVFSVCVDDAFSLALASCEQMPSVL